MLHIQHYIKTVHFWLKYKGLTIVRKTTKLTEGVHRGLQDYRHICYYFYFFTFLRFSKSKSGDFLRFLPCLVRFLKLCKPWASCSLHTGPGLTQPSIFSGSVNEYRL